MAWWWPQQQKDLPAFLAKRCWLELPLKGAPSRRSSLKTCHRHVFLTLGPSRVQVLPRSNEKSQVPQKRYLTFLAGAEGLGLGYRLGRFAAERHWRSLTPRHALRRAQPCLVAESLCALTKNREASIVLASLFLAGAEGLEPSARGFGVDVGKCSKEQGRASVARFLPQV